MADFNGDGFVDVAVANDWPGDVVSVLLNRGDGTLAAPVTYTAGSFSPVSIAAGDLNRDGLPDLAVANLTDDTVSVLLNAGDGTFLPQVTYPTGNYADIVRIGDFNGDGVPDLAVANLNDSTISVFLNIGDGTFRLRGSYVSDFPVSVAVADFNGDGVADLASTDWYEAVTVLLSECQ